VESKMRGSANNTLFQFIFGSNKVISNLKNFINMFLVENKK